MKSIYSMSYSELRLLAKSDLLGVVKNIYVEFG